MRLNKYQPFAWVYFFFNAIGLPFGLTWTALLGPFFYGWVLWKRKTEIILPFLAFFLPFLIAHVLLAETDLYSYTLTFCNLLLIYCFAQAFYTFLKTARDKEKILYRLLMINFIFCLIAIVFYFTPWSNIFWISQNITADVSSFRRLKLFTYEASYYALLFVPLFFYFGWQYFLRQYRRNGTLLLVMLLLPLLLSFSIGIIAAIAAALFCTFLLYQRNLLQRKRIVNSLLNIFVLTGFAIVFLYLFFPDNILFIRLENILAGEDSSGKGRTGDAFLLAMKIIKEKNEWWGIGPGQLKHEGEHIIRSYYLYYTGTAVAIPNAAAETLLLFGWVGLSIRILLLVSLFFITKVYNNYFRLSLFVFMFIYQFTGSYITNPAEYVTWILAFTNVFHQFNVNRLAGKQKNQRFAFSAAASSSKAS